MSEGKTPREPEGGGLDAVLAAWPAPTADTAYWDRSAERVLSLIASGESTSRPLASAASNEDFLRPPLPPLADEGQGVDPIEARSDGALPGTESRERKRATFRDLARLANMSPPPSGPISSNASSAAPSREGSSEEDSGEKPKEREENSGVIHLAALSVEQAAAQAPGEPKPAAASAAAPLATALPAIAPTMRSAGTVPRPAAAPVHREGPNRTGRGWVVIGGVVAAAAVAAGVFFGVSRAQRADGPVAEVTPTAATFAPGVASAPPAAIVPVAPDDRGVDPSSLPPASTAAAVAVRGSATVPAVATSKPSASSAAATVSAAPALVAGLPPASSAAPSAAASGTNLESLMQQAAGVTSVPAVPAATAPDAPSLAAPGSVPLKPSQGAIQGALGAVMPSARACLDPDDPISHATVTFGSDGSVTGVGVSGGASGKPAEACIQGALKRARVAPFAQPTFTATATIRPN